MEKVVPVRRHRCSDQYNDLKGVPQDGSTKEKTFESTQE